MSYLNPLGKPCTSYLGLQQPSTLYLVDNTTQYLLHMEITCHQQQSNPQCLLIQEIPCRTPPNHVNNLNKIPNVNNLNKIPNIKQSLVLVSCFPGEYTEDIFSSFQLSGEVYPMFCRRIIIMCKLHHLVGSPITFSSKLLCY